MIAHSNEELLILCQLLAAGPSSSGSLLEHLLTSMGIVPTLVNAARWRCISQGFATEPRALGEGPSIRKSSGIHNPASHTFYPASERSCRWRQLVPQRSLSEELLAVSCIHL